MATVEKNTIHAVGHSPAPVCEPLRQAFGALLRGLASTGSAADQVRVLGLTSCYRGEGVSTVAVQLAVQAASLGSQRVLLVDFNPGNPSVHRLFHTELAPGLMDVVTEQGEVWSAIRQTSVANLWILPAGIVDRPGQAIYDPAQLQAVVRELKGEFDLVVFDMPALLDDDSTSHLAGLLDGVLLVVEAERTRWEAARRGQQQLVHAQARLLGAVLNKRQQPIPDWLYRLL